MSPAARTERGSSCCGTPSRPALAIVHAVVAALTQRKSADGALRVIGDIADVSRKEALVLLVNGCRDVRPPEKGLHQGRAVVEANLQLDHG